MESQAPQIPDSPPSPAPALTRGIKLLRLLWTRGTLTLDEAARATQVPKASLVRLFRTLERERLVVRRNGSYVAAARILPIADAIPGSDRQIEDALGRIATTTRLAAEWYIPTKEGMVLIKRAEPPAAEVEVRARVGFLRPWRGELDSVATVGIAAFRTDHKSFSGHWTYLRDGVRDKMTSRAARRRIESAREDGYAIDTILNPNGVRRMACSVAALRGALAVAGHFAPSKAGEQEQDLQTMMGEAEMLSSATETGG